MVGISYVGMGTTRLPELVSITMRPSCVRAPPLEFEHGAVSQHDRQRLHPVARRAAFEGCRSAALVATMPPAVAPVNVGAGGNHAPTAASARCMASTVTPGSTVMLWGRTSITLFMRPIARIVSPIGVAPPVSDDCAPIASTVRFDRRAINDVVDGSREDDACGMAAGEVSSVLEKQAIVVSHQSSVVSRQSGSHRCAVAAVPPVDAD